MRILLVEDDLMLGKAVKKFLEESGNIVDWVEDYELAQTAFKSTSNGFDILLLDINLPGKSGLEILKSLRVRNNPIPVLILTARDAIYQKIEGLNLGADDYLTKPFDLYELQARIISLHRRSKGIANPTLIHDDLELNPFNHKLLQAGEEIVLSPKEFAILKILLENIDKVISKSHLENLLYSWNDAVESNTVEVHIHHLRNKLGRNLIKTVRGIGYVIERKND